MGALEDAYATDTAKSTIPSSVSTLSSIEWVDTGEDVTIQLQPGPIGIAIKDRSGLVFEVNDGQCKDKGVAVGWICSEIDGRPYDISNFREKISGTSEYTVKFRARSRRT